MAKLSAWTLKNQLRLGHKCCTSRASFMRKTTLFFVVFACSCLVANAIRGAHLASPKPQFAFKNAAGKTERVSVVTSYYPKKLNTKKLTVLAKVDSRLNPKLLRAATIAEERAHARSRARCWHYVKEALLASGVIHSYPKTVYAKQAGHELVNTYGFKKLPVRDPFKAPVGAVLVYGATRAAGHVEIRTRDGFVSDFKSRVPSPRRLIGIYAKS